MVSGGNTERRGVAITGLWSNSFFVHHKVSINSNVLTINTVKMKISKTEDRKTKYRWYFQVLGENNFIAATKKCKVKMYLKIICQSYFWCTKKHYKGLYWAIAKISVLKILSDCFRCQLIASLFIKYSLDSSRIFIVSITALLPYLEFCSIPPNLVHSPEDPGIRSPLLTPASVRSGGPDILAH